MTLMPGGAREWNRVNRPSFRGISSLNRMSSMSMLLIRTTRSLVSHVSYCAGMYLTAALAARARFGEEPELDPEPRTEDDDDEVEDLLRDTEEAVCR